MRFGKRNKGGESVYSHLVKRVDVSVIVDKEDGRKFIHLTGRLVNGEGFEIAISNKLFKKLMDTTEPYLD